MALPRVRIERHRSARALVLAFVGGKRLEDGGLEGVDGEGKLVRVNGRVIAANVRRLGLWAWVDTTKKVPVIHYWHRADADRLQVAALLGHEVGHFSGRPLRSRRNDWREELRADEYAAATYLALRQVLSRR